MQGNSFDELPPAFQRYAHDEYLGGEGNRLRGMSREERNMLYGEREMRRTLHCKDKLRELLKGTYEPISLSDR